MRALHSPGRAAAAGAAALAVLATAAQPAAAQGPSAERAIDLALRGAGGEQAVRSLDAFRLRATGRTAILDEGPRPGNSSSPASTFRVSLEYDIAGDRLRADSVRTSLGADRRVSEVIAGRRGYIAGADQNFPGPPRKAMTSDRWGAITRQQRLLNPHVYLQAVLARPRAASVVGSSGLRGRRHTVLSVRGDVAPVRLHVDARSGRLDRLVTEDHNYNRGDVRTVVDYAGWRRAAGSAVRFPARVTIRQAGQVLHAERRTAVRANPALRGARFRIPAGVDATYERALAQRGLRTSMWLMTFAHLGFVKDGAADTVVPVAVAPGSTLIQGNGNQSMIVEQQDGIVVVEGALNDYRAEALIAYVEETFPGKPIRYVTAGHHHADHAGGMRPFVALGARPVVHADSVAFFERVFSVRGSRLLPDRLDESEEEAEILAVPPAGTVTLADPLRPVILLAEPTEHASTTVLTFVPAGGVLFVNGDTYGPGSPPGPGARSLDATIRSAGLAVEWIVGGHGGVISYADFQAALAAAA